MRKILYYLSKTARVMTVLMTVITFVMVVGELVADGAGIGDFISILLDLEKAIMTLSIFVIIPSAIFFPLKYWIEPKLHARSNPRVNNGKT